MTYRDFMFSTLKIIVLRPPLNLDGARIDPLGRMELIFGNELLLKDKE